MSLYLPFYYYIMQLLKTYTQEKFIHARVSDSFTSIVLKTFFTESDAYVFICVFCL